MPGLITKSLVFFGSLLANPSYANVLPQLSDRSSAAACSSTTIQNGGFETVNLGPWFFKRTYEPTIKQAGIANCQVSTPGASSTYSALTNITSIPGDWGNQGKLQQSFNGCQGVNYTITWSMLQVKGSTMYDAKATPPTMEVSLYSPKGVTYGLASFNVERTSFSYNDRAKKTFQAGVWVAQTESRKLAETGNWTVYFRTSAVSPSSDTVKKSFAIRIDQVVVKPVV